MDKIYQEFIITLFDEQKTMLESLFDGFGGLEAEHSKSAFIKGFKLGMLAALEVCE